MSPLVDVVHTVLEESEVWLVPGLQSPDLITAQLPHVFLRSGSQCWVTLLCVTDLHHSRGVPSLGWVPHLVAAHHLRQPSELEHQVLLLPVLQVDDVGEVSQTRRAVSGVEAPVEVLAMIIINDRLVLEPCDLVPRLSVCSSSGCRSRTLARWAWWSSARYFSPARSSSRAEWCPSSSGSESWPAGRRSCRKPSGPQRGLGRRTTVSL